MADLVDTIKQYVKSPKKHLDSDEIDQLNFFVTPLILNVVGLLLALKSFFGSPIQCWVPAEFTKTFEQYTENFCFVQNTYWVTPGEPLPEVEDRQEGEIGYYQWVPIFLFIQASLFYIPQAIWSYISSKNGVLLESIVKEVLDHSLSLDPSGDESEKLRIIADYIYRAASQHKELKKTGYMSSIVHRSRYLVTCYFFTKILYLLQILMQYYLMHLIIGAESYFWGYELVSNAFEGKDWEETRHFPRETMCDFYVRYPGTTRHVTVQCVLLVNIINEKIYLFLWFYLIFLFTITTMNLLSWTWVLFIPSNRLGFVEDHLLLSSERERERETLGKREECRSVSQENLHTEEKVKNFTEKFLKIDGVFVMMLINKKAGSLVTHDILKALWKMYCKEVKHRTPDEDGFNFDHVSAAEP